MADFPKDLHNVALYLRKSRADVEAEAHGDGETLSKHRSVLLQIASTHRYTITDTYEEIVSGERILDRPEMQRLLQAVHHGAYSAVLCMDLDRLGRGNMVDQGLIQEAFKSTKTLIITPRKMYDLQDELDEEWSEFEAFMARRELKIITRRLQRGRKQSAGMGKSISKKPPYGYLRDEKLKLFPDPETAPVVKLMFSMAAAGKGLGQIANHLTRLGVPTPTGKPIWERSSVSVILKNPVYLGNIVWGRTRYEKSRSVASKYERRRSAPEDWLVYENAHEPLVNEETVQRYLTRLPRIPKVALKKELSNPLAGLLYCSQCGRAMQRQPVRNRPSNRLLCKTYGCKTKSASFELVEEHIVQALRKTLNQLIFELNHEEKMETTEQESILRIAEQKQNQMEAQISQILKQKGNLHDLLEQGIYDVKTYEERGQILEERLTEANQQRALLQKEMEEALAQKQRRNKSLPKFTSIMDAYDAAQTVELKNQLLRTVIEKITFTRHQIWTKPDQFEAEISLRF